MLMTINYVHYYAVSPRVASESTHYINSTKRKCQRHTSIFSLDYSRDRAFLNPERVTHVLEVTSQELQLTSDKGDQMVL